MDKEKELEQLMENFFDADQLESPSLNFTTAVVEQIKAEQRERLTYRPLLPNWVFFAIGILVLVCICVVMAYTDVSVPQVDYFSRIDFSMPWLTETMSNVSFSNSFVYGILALGLLVCLQARLLNGLLNRKGSLA